MLKSVFLMIIGLDRVVEYKKNNDLIIEEMIIMEVEIEEVEVVLIEEVVVAIAEVAAVVAEIAEAVVTVETEEAVAAAEEVVEEVTEEIDYQKIKMKQRTFSINSWPNSNKRTESLHLLIF